MRFASITMSSGYSVASEITDLAARIDQIERSYEYLLAYAAQGRQDDQGSEARQYLTSMHGSLDGFANEARRILSGDDVEGSGIRAFLDAVERDAGAARGAIGLVLQGVAISSILVDNLNASVHLRALLTDAFLIEQALKAPRNAAGALDKVSVGANDRSRQRG